MNREDSEGIAAVKDGIRFFMEAMACQECAETISGLMLIFRTQVHGPVLY